MFVSKTVSAFIKDVVEFFQATIGSYKRQPRRFGPKGFDPFRTEIQSLEKRLVLAAPMLGAELATYELNTVFGSFNGRGGSSLIIDGDLYTPGNDGHSPVVSKVNLMTGQATTLVFEGEGDVSGVFKKDGQIFFVGLSLRANNRGYDVTYWDKDGRATIIPNEDSSSPFSVSPTGRMALEMGDKAGYADVGENILHYLPGVSGFDLKANSIPSNRYIGAGGFNSAGDTIGIVYELNPVSGQYSILKSDYKSSRGEDVSLMILHETSGGVVGLAYFYKLEAFADWTAILGLDGTVLAEIEGTTNSGVAVGDKFFTTTLGPEGKLYAFNKDWGKEVRTPRDVFGVDGIEFQRGSLAAYDGKITITGTRVSDGQVFVKVIEVPQDPTLSQVKAIIVPSLEVGQVDGRVITWEAVTGATGYRYEISLGLNVVSSGSVATNSLVVPASMEAGEYTLTIQATAGSIQGPVSDDVTMVVTPRAPRALTVEGLPTVATRNPVEISWEAVPGAESYDVEVLDASGNVNARIAPLYSAVSRVHTFTLPSLRAGVYFLRVCTNQNGEKSAVTQVRFAVDLNAVDISRTVTPSTPAVSTVTWTPVPDTLRYEVWVSRSGNGNVNEFGGFVGTNPSFSLQKLPPGAYGIRIRAHGASPEITSAFSPWKMFRVTVEAVGNITANHANPTQAFNIDWSDVEFAATYDVKVFDFTENAYIINRQTAVSSLNIREGLGAGRYRVFVTAKDQGGFSSPRRYFDFTINPLPQVAGINVVNGIEGAIASLTFGTVPRAAKYEVWVTSLKNRQDVLRTEVTSRTVNLPNLAAGGYRVFVRAIDAKGRAGTWSNPAIVTITSPTKQIKDLLFRLKDIDLSRLAVQVKDSKGKVVGTYRSTSQAILGFMSLKAGDYTVKAGHITLDFTIFKPAVTPTVRVGADNRPEVSWVAPAGSTTEVLFVKDGRHHSKIVSGQTYKVPNGFPTGIYKAYVQVLHKDGTKTRFAAPVTVDVGGQPTVTARGSIISWTYTQTPATSYKLMFVKEVKAGIEKVGTSVVVTGKSVNFSTLQSLPKGKWKVRICAMIGNASSSRWSEYLTIEKK